MEKDRRSAPRVRVNLSARWEGVLTQQKGTITDLSRTGCFILSGGKVGVRELIWLQIDLPHQQPVHFWAEVVDAAYEIGFAVKFNAGEEDDERRLASFLEGIFRSMPKTK